MKGVTQKRLGTVLQRLVRRGQSLAADYGQVNISYRGLQSGIQQQMLERLISRQRGRFEWRHHQQRREPTSVE